MLNIYDKEQITYDIYRDGLKTIYNFHIHRVLIAKALIVRNEDTYIIKKISTINFNTNNNNHHDQLEGFIDDQLTYEQSRSALQAKYIPHLGTKVLQIIISDIKNTGGRRLELQSIPTSRGFYDKVCTRLQEQKSIEIFSFNQHNRLVILLNKSQK